MTLHNDAPRGEGRGRRWPILLLAVFLAPMIACGTFSVQRPMESAAPEREPPAAPLPTSTPIVIPTPQPAAPAAVQGSGGSVEDPSRALPSRVNGSNVNLTLGERARVIVPQGMNLRQEPFTTAEVAARLQEGALVNVVDGPFRAEEIFWWQVETVEHGIEGMLAEGVGDSLFVEPAVGALVAVNRAPVVGDAVRLLQRLNVRAQPTINGTVVEVAEPGMELEVVDGPQSQDGYTWFRLRNDDGSVMGWAVDRIGDNRTLSPLE